MNLLNPTGQDSSMANCFLAYAQAQQGQPMAAVHNWKRCIEDSLPSYIHEFHWLIQVGRSDVAYCLNSENVVAGYQGKCPSGLDKWCDSLDVQ